MLCTRERSALCLRKTQCTVAGQFLVVSIKRFALSQQICVLRAVLYCICTHACTLCRRSVAVSLETVAFGHIYAGSRH
jgi:hypothetical protein